MGELRSLNKQFLDDPIVELEVPHKDERGVIQPLVDEDMKSAVMIESKKGTVRANHFHKTDWHYCLVISGSIDYYHRPVGDSNPPKHTLVKTGQTFFTPPMVEHAMVFPEDTKFLCLGKNSRDQEVYENDITRIKLYPEEVLGAKN
ncbi:MAG: cupin domain-containing protein [Pseudobacteriovorax sp.]|nr:cupin domain-containing protein [Pseudobacteriovorax sp.]